MGEDKLFIFGHRADLVEEVRERQKREGAAKIDWRFSNALERIRSGDFGRDAEKSAHSRSLLLL